MKKILFIDATAFITIIAFTLAFAQAPAASIIMATTISTGTISQFTPDTIVVRTTTSIEPVSYSHTKDTIYVDESGNAVSMKTVKAGLPVTVYYEMESDWRLIVTKVIVRKTTTPTMIIP